MDTESIRNFRPVFHFTPPQMWMNDPNGLVFVNGEYHLFYQHYPEDTVWGPMHWGHAVSRDLIDWKHLPIALYPDRLGTIFSGSAVLDRDNTSGFGSPQTPPLVAMYTQDCGEGELHRQSQSIAYSLDGLHFTKYFGNPVIPCPEGRRDFRDPKIFPNRITGTWGMVLAAGDHAEFFSSKDLIHWEKTGEFGPSENMVPGVWECPDLFELESPSGSRYVLLVSMGMNAAQGGSRTQYFIGDFDGRTFRAQTTDGAPLWLDEGFDNYAGVTFSNAPSRILIGWADNWQYAAACPTGDFRGSMTLARRLSLRQTEKGLRLSSCPIGLAPYLSDAFEIRSGEKLPGESFVLRVQGYGDAEISLENGAGRAVFFGVKGDSFFFDRSRAGLSAFSQTFGQTAYSRRQVPRLFSGAWKMQVVFDVSQIEIFFDGGAPCMSSVIFPEQPYDTVYVCGEASVLCQSLSMKQKFENGSAFSSCLKIQGGV